MKNAFHPMTLVMPGVWQGSTVRAERRGRTPKVKAISAQLWYFEMRGRELGPMHQWLEFAPFGHWCAIGGWLTLKGGLCAYRQLVNGTHFWDEDRQATRRYDEEVYAAIRGEK